MPACPLFGRTTPSRIRTDELQRVYIYPCRIMKASGVQQADVLLNRGNGQPEMGKRGMAAIRTLPGDTATLILDYGRELHGAENSDGQFVKAPAVACAYPFRRVCTRM